VSNLTKAADSIKSLDDYVIVPRGDRLYYVHKEDADELLRRLRNGTLTPEEA
jgi:hypothetical protein